MCIFQTVFSCNIFHDEHLNSSEIYAHCWRVSVYLRGIEEANAEDNTYRGVIFSVRIMASTLKF